VYSNKENWKDFAPMGFNGIFRGASVVFFAYLVRRFWPQGQLRFSEALHEAGNVMSINALCRCFGEHACLNCSALKHSSTAAHALNSSSKQRTACASQLV
jgi:hypothetical protein